MTYEHKMVVTFGDTNAEGNMGHDRNASGCRDRSCLANY